MITVDELLTAEQAAPIVDLHPVTLLRYAREGRITVVCVGRKRRFRRRDLEAYLDGNTRFATVGAVAVPSVPQVRPSGRNPNRTYRT